MPVRVVPCALVLCALALAASLAQAEEPSSHLRAVEQLEAQTQGDALPEAFEQLAHACVFQADWVEQDPERRKSLRRKAMAAALRGLARVPELSSVHLGQMEELESAGAMLPKSAAGLHHWAAVAYCELVPSESAFHQMSAARRCKRLLERTVSLDGAYFHGDPWRALAGFLLKAPSFVGGDEKGAQRALAKALAVDHRFGPSLLLEIELLERTKAPAAQIAQKTELLAKARPDGEGDAAPELAQAAAKARERLGR